MDRCHYYLNNGLWKVVEKYFDPNNKLENDFMWSVAVHPNYYSFGSHIISSPWQQSWMALNLLEGSQKHLNNDNENNGKDSATNTISILRKELDFQYILKDCASDSFVQQLFSIYSKIVVHVPVNFSDIDTKLFNSNLKQLLLMLLTEKPSAAHMLLKHILRHGYFTSTCEAFLREAIDNSLCNLIASALCKCDKIIHYIPSVTNLLQTPFRRSLCLLLLANDNISILHSMIEEDKKLFRSSGRIRLQALMDNGIQPLTCFKDMTTMERHFFLQILDLINDHMDEFDVMANSPNIPSFIWPVVLFQNWNNSSLSDSTLLKLIDKCKESTKDKTIIQITYTLEWYISFCKWYEKHEGPLKTSTAERKEDLLKKANEHSVLYLINNTTDLSQSDWTHIKGLLQQGRCQNGEGRTWDLVVFDAYCIMILVIESIIKSSAIEHLAKLQKVKLEDILILNDAFSSLYSDEITETLKKVRMMLHSFYPRAFRLEVLENIFASIFLTYDDVKNLSYFHNCTVDLEKHLEKAQMRRKAVPDDDSDTFKSGRNHGTTNSPLQISVKSEDEPTKKQKLRGFLCKKYIVRDLIYLVKECLEKLEEDPETQSDSLNLPCSIKPAQMENRLDRLLESVSEASWRLQLVTDPEFVSQVGTMQYACGQDPDHHFEAEWMYVSHDLDRTGLLKTRRKTAEKSNDSGSQSNSNPGNGTANVDVQNLKQLKVVGSPGIMYQMLACDSSLVVHCLSQGDVLNADHIIQMMSTEENRPNLEGELNFTRAINDLKKKLVSISVESPVKRTNFESTSKSRSLQSIQLVATQAINSTALTNLVERFLSAHTLPSIQSHSKVSAGSVLQCIENTAAMVTIDLALTTATTFQDFKDLLNIASKHCPELNTRIQSPISAHSTSTKPLGYIVFSQNLVALLQEINRNQGNDSPEVSLNEFFRAHQYPLSLKSLKENINFWKHLSLAFADYEKNLEESKALVSCKEGLLVKCQKNIKDTQSIFETVSKLSESSSEFMDLGKAEPIGGETQKSVSYCDLLSRYLSDLSSFILENVTSKGEIAEPITFHNLLEQSAVEIVDKLIFEYNIEPGALEKKAQQLGFNLSASLIAGCCPRLPQMTSSVETLKCPPSDRIVLNELYSDYKSLPPSNPFEVVRSILSELLIALQTFSENKQRDEEGIKFGKNLLTKADMAELRNDMKIQSILEKTVEINFVVLKSLNEKELRYFFSCLLNLMMCHCYLSSKLEKTDGIYSKHRLFRTLGYLFLGYNVGELGFMSVLDVKTILLGETFNCGFSPRRQDHWDWLPLRPDPRLAFLIVDFTAKSPPLFLIRHDEFETQIEEAITNYVQSTVAVKNHHVIINEFLESYLINVALNQTNDDVALSEEGEPDRNQLIISFLLDHSRGDLHSQLRDLSLLDVPIEIRSTNHKEIILKLDYFVTFVEEEAEEELVEKWLSRTVNDSILKHFNQTSRILADIVQKIHEAKEPIQTEVARDVLTEEKLKYLDLLLSAPWLPQASPLFHNNTVITALSKYPDERKMVKFFEACVADKDWNKCLEVLFALPDYFVFSDLNVKRFKDVALREATILATKGGQHNSWYFSEHISDVDVRIETIVECSTGWPGPVCCDQLSSILRDNLLLAPQKRAEITSLIKKINVYSTILEVVAELDAKTWFDVSRVAKESPKTIIKSLLRGSQLELCLQWVSLPGIINKIQEFIDSDFVLPFFENLTQDFDSINEILNSLPREKLIDIYDEVIFDLTSISSISSLVQKAIALDPNSIRYRLVEISLNFLHDVDSDEQSRLVPLISSPILIIEQLLMNTKLDALEKVLKIARRIENEQFINQEEINTLIVTYAKKALELDLVKSVRGSETKQSFLLGTTSQTSHEHLVPSEVPDRSQWVPDNTVSLCMCCRLVSFSMFNRRHHCRRCGRVICGTCSTHRMKVAGYKGVAVRVCQNCYVYQNKMDGDAKCSQSIDTFDSSNFTFQDSHYWRLSTDISRNSTVRDEFSYEYSPNVTLCLALFNLLPDPAYLSVLLEESQNLLKLLQMNGKSENPELDCGVVVQIIRSLILGAKVKYGQAGLMSGVDCCDELLSQVDILQLLINNYCSSLIPTEPLSGAAVRFLRDKLVEEELWDLALEVSTKCGLDRSGVWASWGKVCLAAGAWEEARAKFAYCLKPTPKPARNPPLVEEICRILESPTAYVNAKTAQKMPDKGGLVAQEVAQVLSTIKALSQGKSLPSFGVSAKSSVQYEEEIFYLTTYGSHQALLSFYLKHDEIKTALEYLLQERLEPDVFLDCLLLPSYRSDNHEKLKSSMISVDPSLESFKKYLSHSCLHMEKLCYLHTLYDLQILMQDHVRAAVTCIRLYQKNAANFTDLVSRSNHLHSALRHFEEELAIQTKKTKRLDCIMKMDPKVINRHMNTIWRQLEVAKFLSTCESQDKFTAKDLFPEEVVSETEVPTLFDGSLQRTVLAKMIILLGKNIAEGFGIAFRIIQDHQLDLRSICKETGKKLAENARVNDIKALVDCLKTSGVGDFTSTVDETVGLSLPILTRNEVPLADLEPLCKLIRNVNLRISALIDTRQLIPAYILAAKHNRLSDVQHIMEVAEQLGLPIIKKICMNKLQSSSETRSSGDGVSLPGSDTG